MTAMARKVHRVPVRLDANGVERLSPDELKAILRGADDLNARWPQPPRSDTQGFTAKTPVGVARERGQQKGVRPEALNIDR